MGVCWDVYNEPTVDLSTKTEQYVSAGNDGLGTFKSTLTDLAPGTKYYVRAYARNGAGISYGNLDSLVTFDYPTVVTLSVASFASNTGIGGGNITNGGGEQILQSAVYAGGYRSILFIRLIIHQKVEGLAFTAVYLLVL